jgi:hypothetical protein
MFYVTAVFRRNKGDKDVKLLENGCPTAFFTSDKIDAFGLTYEWAAFKFRDQDEIHFTVRLSRLIVIIIHLRSKLICVTHMIRHTVRGLLIVTME